MPGECCHQNSLDHQKQMCCVCTATPLYGLSVKLLVEVLCHQSAVSHHSFLHCVDFFEMNILTRFGQEFYK